MLLSWTQQTDKQESQGIADLVLARSSDEGANWSSPEVAFEGRLGEPRATGTVTQLRSGQLVLPFAERNDSKGTSGIRILSSSDHGRSWSVCEPEISTPLVWLTPHGRVVEASDGRLVMPVHGARTEGELKSAIHSCGLLRSEDAGRHWGDFTYLAEGDSGIIGATSSGRFGFEAPTVEVLEDATWLAVVTARRLGETLDAPQVLCRLYSRDQGQHWSKPDQVSVGSWSSLVRMEGQTVVCPYADWSAWGAIKCLVSHDGLGTFTQDELVMHWGWMRGCSRANVTEEVPPPPTVPYLVESWDFDFYGFPSVEALDKDSFAVAIGRPRQDSLDVMAATGRLEQGSATAKGERIDVVFFQRVGCLDGLAGTKRPRAKPITPPGEKRWVLTERFHLDKRLYLVSRAPDGTTYAMATDKSFQCSRDHGRTWGLLEGPSVEGIEDPVIELHITPQGRWLLICGRSDEDNLARTPAGREGGYPIVELSGDPGYRWGRSYYSDDEGRTWHGGRKILGPAVALFPGPHVHHAPDGTLMLPAIGRMPDAHESLLLFRSHDGGKTWGDATVMADPPRHPGAPHRDPSYTYETDLASLDDTHWRAFIRAQYTAGGPQGGGFNFLAVADSLDGGVTWSRPQRTMVTGGQLQLLRLPDGALALIQRTHSWQQSGVSISHDNGLTWRYAMAGPYDMGWSLLCGPEEMLVVAGDGTAARYRLQP